jgi:hypothetical protein
MFSGSAGGQFGSTARSFAGLAYPPYSSTTFHRGETGRNVWLLLRQVDRTARTTRQCYVDLQLPGLRPSDGRYASPDEVDLMARAAGLEPVGRWSGWSGVPFRPEVLTYHAAYRRGSGSGAAAAAGGTGISSGTSRSG